MSVCFAELCLLALVFAPVDVLETAQAPLRAAAGLVQDRGFTSRERQLLSQSRHMNTFWRTRMESEVLFFKNVLHRHIRCWFFLASHPISALKIPRRLTIHNELASMSSLLYTRWLYPRPTLASDHQSWMFRLLNAPSNVSRHTQPPTKGLLHTPDHKFRILQLLLSSDPYWFHQIHAPARKELHDRCSCEASPRLFPLLLSKRGWQTVLHGGAWQTTWEQLCPAISFPSCKSRFRKGLVCYRAYTGNSPTSTWSQATAASKTATCLLTWNTKSDRRAAADSSGGSAQHFCLPQIRTPSSQFVSFHV